MRAYLYGLLAAGMLTGVTPALAQLPAEAVDRPRVGLVLSGGGARGAAHVGVLKVLEQLQVPIDAIAGTSMGAVVGGLYATGMSATQVERELASVDWQDAFRDRPPRAGLNFRRKREDRDFLVQLPLGWRDGRFQLPSGLVQGQKLSQLLRVVTLPASDVADFDALPTRFRAVATDLETGAPVVMRDGDLATALRASLSAPGIFVPVERDGRLLVDGGIANNLPVDVARGMGVDVLIVVDVGFPLAARAGLGSVANVANQTLTILIRRESERQLATLAARDVLVSPSLPGISSYAFTGLRNIMAAGEAAALGMKPRLEALAVPPESYERYVAQRRRPLAIAQIHAVQVEPASAQFAVPIQTLFGDLAGKPFDLTEVTRRVNRYYGQGLLESLDFRLRPNAMPEVDRDTADLLFAVQPNSWGPNYVRFGMRLQDDFAGNSTFDAAMRVLLTNVNSLGAEWSWDGQLGGNPRLGTQLYLPLSQRRLWFIEPAALFEVRAVPQFEQALQVGELRVRSLRFGASMGREIGQSAEFRVGAERELGRSRVRLGDVTAAPQTFHSNELYASFSYDSLDSAAFPRRGGSAVMEWRGQISEDSPRRVADSANLDWRYAYSWGKNTAIAWTSAGSLLNAAAADERSQFSLGGFLNLSGLSANSLLGPNYGIARLLYYRKIGSGGDGFLNVPLYAGMSLETGDVWAQRRQIGLSSARQDMSLFLGMDTFLGPAWLAAGWDSGGHHAFYLSLGRGF